MKSQLLCSDLKVLLSTGEASLYLLEFLLSNHCFYLLNEVKNFDLSNYLEKHITLNNYKYKEQYGNLRLVFQKIDFPYAVVKGSVLAKNAYKQTGLRNSTDIDILVEKKHADKLKYILCENDFCQAKIFDRKIRLIDREELLFYSLYTHQLAPFLKVNSNRLCPYINVDVNTSVFWGEYSGDNSYQNKILSEIENDELYGVKFKRLRHEMEFISLCLHHYKDMNSIYLLSTRGLNFNNFLDIFLFIENVNMNLDVLLLNLEMLKAGEYVYYCLYYTSLILPSKKITETLEKMQKYANDSVLNSYGLSEMEKKIWNIEFYERVFNKDQLIQYVKNNLTADDLKKISLNTKFM